MSIKIDDPATVKLAQEFATASGTTPEAGIRRALEEALHGEHLRSQVRQLQDEFAALPKGDPNFAIEDLYDEHGLPV